MLLLVLGIYLVLGSGGGWLDLGLTALILLVYVLSILFHELAHCWMAIRLGAGADEIVLGPLGGVSYVGHSPSYRTEVLIAGVGPVSNFLLTGLCLGALVLTGAPWRWGYLNPLGGWSPVDLTIAQRVLLQVALINETLGLFNLLVPAYPLDGGRILYAVLSARHGRTRGAEIATAIAMPIGLLIAIWGFARWNILLGIIGVSVVFDAWQLRRLARMGELDAHPAFATGPEYEYMPERQRRPGFLARWREGRARRRVLRESARQEELRGRVDAILEKVSREGIGSLSADERRILDEASRRPPGGT